MNDPEDAITPATDPGFKENEPTNGHRIAEEENVQSNEDHKMDDGIDNVDEQDTHSIQLGLKPTTRLGHKTPSTPSKPPNNNRRQQQSISSHRIVVIAEVHNENCDYMDQTVQNRSPQTKTQGKVHCDVLGEWYDIAVGSQKDNNGRDDKQAMVTSTTRTIAVEPAPAHGCAGEDKSSRTNDSEVGGRINAEQQHPCTPNPLKSNSDNHQPTSNHKIPIPSESRDTNSKPEAQAIQKQLYQSKRYERVQRCTIEDADAIICASPEDGEKLDACNDNKISREHNAGNLNVASESQSGKVSSVMPGLGLSKASTSGENTKTTMRKFLPHAEDYQTEAPPRGCRKFNVPMTEVVLCVAKNDITCMKSLTSQLICLAFTFILMASVFSNRGQIVALETLVNMFYRYELALFLTTLIDPMVCVIFSSNFRKAAIPMFKNFIDSCFSICKASKPPVAETEDIELGIIPKHN